MLNKFINEYNNCEQYHLNYLVIRIKKFWKRYYYLAIIENSYNEDVTERIVYFM